jgi:hypothetical protein
MTAARIVRGEPVGCAKAANVGRTNVYVRAGEAPTCYGLYWRIQASERKRMGGVSGPRRPMAGCQRTPPTSAGSRKCAARMGSASARSARARGAPRQWWMPPPNVG